MLARASSDAGTRVRRSKSASNVHRNPPPISEPWDPDVAQQHAVAAAAVAFSRAQAQAQAQAARDPAAKRSSEVSRSKSNASRKSLTSQGQGSHFPPRDSSFRSVKAQKAGQQATSTQCTSRASALDTEKFPQLYPMPTISDRPASAPRPLSTQPSIAFSEHSRLNTNSRANRQSASSSVASQQIRKARSMYYASSVQTGSPIARPPAKYLTTPLTVKPSPEVPVALAPARKAGPSPLASPRIPVTVAGDETLDQARDNYLQSFQERSVKHKPSLFLAPFKKRRDKGKDKGKRLSSGVLSGSLRSQQTATESTGDVTLDEFMPQPDKKEKRSFSGSLRSKFKSVFRRASNKSSNLPVQQIEASRDYFGTTFSSPEEVLTNHAVPVPNPDDDLLRRVRSRTPSLDISHPAYLGPSSRSSSHGSARSEGSQRSLHSEANSTNASMSRVTSWCTSSTRDTLAQRAIKRLTVIHESKDSIGSEAEHVGSTPVKRKSLPFSALTAFRDPMPMDGLLEDSPATVDPKRVFSALMKEINTTKSVEADNRSIHRTPGAESDVFESSRTKELHSSTSKDIRPNTASDPRPPSRRPPSVAAQSTHSKASSIRTLGRAIRSTIRTVTPSECHSPPSPKGAFGVRINTRAWKQDVSSSPSSASNQSDTNDARLVNGEPLRDVFSPSPTQIEKRVEKAKNRWKTPLDDAEQLHNPRDLDRTYAVSKLNGLTLSDNTSNESFKRPEPLRFGPEVCMDHTPPASPRSPVSCLPRPVMSPMSPSVYSRNTDGASIFPNDSALSMNEPAGSLLARDSGSAVVLASQSVRSYVVGTPTRRLSESTRNSRDWKAWLSHEVSSMEFSSQEDLKIHERYQPSPSHFHREEVAPHPDNERDETTVILREPCFTSPRHDQTGTKIASGTTEAGNPACPQSANVRSQRTTTESDAHELQGTELLPLQSQSELPSSHTSTSISSIRAHTAASRPGSTPLLSMQRPSLPHTQNSSASQPLFETPKSARMNDRFPYLNTSRCSSSNSARSSRTSKSPPKSVASSSKSKRGTPSARVYTDLSAPSSIQSSRIPQTATKRAGLPNDSKENITPASAHVKNSGRLHNSPLGSSPRNKATRPCLSAVLDGNTKSTDQNTNIILNMKSAARNGIKLAPSVSRPLVRATLRPISPEKLSRRRPKSAFDLRGSHIPQSRPASELRRPALHFKSAISSSESMNEPSVGAEDGTMDGSENGGRSGSVTPGQRMADRFLKERKSTGVLDNKKYRGGLRLVREDTPAFL